MARKKYNRRPKYGRFELSDPTASARVGNILISVHIDKTPGAPNDGITIRSSSVLTPELIAMARAWVSGSMGFTLQEYLDYIMPQEAYTKSNI